MHRIDGPTAAPELPAAKPVSGTPGYFTSGDPLSSTAPTVPTQDWFNTVQEEICGVVEHASVALDKGNRGQLLAALLATFVAKGGGGDFELGGGQWSVPLGGGVIMKLGSKTGSYVEQSISEVFTTPFPTGCKAVFAIAIDTSGSDLRDSWPKRVSKSATGFTLFMEWSGAGGGSSTAANEGFDWVAFGN